MFNQFCIFYSPCQSLPGIEDTDNEFLWCSESRLRWLILNHSSWKTRIQKSSMGKISGFSHVLFIQLILKDLSLLPLHVMPCQVLVNDRNRYTCNVVSHCFLTRWDDRMHDEPESHDDVIKWKHFPRYWPFVRGIHRSAVNSPHKGQWRGALMFSLIYAWRNGWVNDWDTGDLRRHRTHYDVTVMNSKRVDHYMTTHAAIHYIDDRNTK